MKPPGYSPDDFQTPSEALYPLLPYLEKDWVIREGVIMDKPKCPHLRQTLVGDETFYVV